MNAASVTPKQSRAIMVFKLLVYMWAENRNHELKSSISNCLKSSGRQTRPRTRLWDTFCPKREIGVMGGIKQHEQ